ncbi:hypothetical protein BGZ58_005736 [Dissophora ornata]|nr:hypothetical protein BGZ58_005736 [Dissophora ornata]
MGPSLNQNLQTQESDGFYAHAYSDCLWPEHMQHPTVLKSNYPQIQHDPSELIHFMDGAAKEILETHPDNARVANYREIFKEPSFARSCQRLFTPKARSKAAGANNSTSSYSLRDATVEKRKIPTPAEDPVIEVDDWDLDQVFVQGRAESVGHIIKKAAADLVPIADTLSQVRRRQFVLGMSSILDLADLSPEGQLCNLFNKDQQEELKKRYKYLNQLKLTTLLIPEELNLHLEMTVVSLAK